MNKRILAALAVFLLLFSAAAEAETVVTSFYPIYLFALNLCDGIGDITVHNLAAPDFGCLHDYQLTVSDMKALSRADVFCINGAGMEEYLTHVYDALPDLRVIDASDGAEEVRLLDGDGDPVEHDHDDEDHDHEEEEEHHHGHDHHHDVNPHIWMSVSNAVIMIRNLADGLCETMPQYETYIRRNCKTYTERLEALDTELKAVLNDLPYKDIVTFHEAFPYFAEAYGLNVVAVMAVEPGDSLNPKEMMDLVRAERELGNPPLFTEPQYDSPIALTIASETGAPVYSLDPCVTGPEKPELTRYEDVMRENLRVLREALGGEQP